MAVLTVLAVVVALVMLIAVVLPISVVLIVAFARWAGVDGPRDYSSSDDVTFFRSGL